MFNFIFLYNIFIFKKMIITEKLTKENPIIFNSIKEKIININTITLESADDILPIDVFCSNKKNKEVFKICSLKKNSNEIYSTSIMLDLHNLNDKYEFYLKTKCKKVLVNIIGFYEEEEEEEEKEKEENELSPKNKIKKEKKKKKEKSESNSESDSDDDNLDNNLNDNKPDISLVELLNKKRKEEPQDIKPIVLKNLTDKKNDTNLIKSDIKDIKDKKEKKDKIKDKKVNQIQNRILMMII